MILNEKKNLFDENSQFVLTPNQIEKREEQSKNKFSLSNIKSLEGKKTVFVAEKKNKKVKLKIFEDKIQAENKVKVLLNLQTKKITPHLLGWRGKRIITEFIEGNKQNKLK